MVFSQFSDPSSKLNRRTERIFGFSMKNCVKRHIFELHLMISIFVTQPRTMIPAVGSVHFQQEPPERHRFRPKDTGNYWNMKTVFPPGNLRIFLVISDSVQLFSRGINGKIRKFPGEKTAYVFW